MTVEELIEILQTYPPDMKLALRGYEGGFEDVSFIDEMVLVLEYNQHPSYMGRHEDFDYVDVLYPEEISNYDVQEYLVFK